MAIQTALVVDDSRSARYILQRLLEQRQIQVAVAASAQQAFDYLRAYRPDVVFMDDKMPGMDGLEAVERLGVDPCTADIPVILYTASDELAKTDRAARLASIAASARCGVIGVLSKPFTQTDVNLLLAQLDEVPSGRPDVPQLRRLPAVEEPPVAVAVAAPSPQPKGAASHMQSLDTLRAQLAESLKTEARQLVEQIFGEQLETRVGRQIERHTALWRQALEHVRLEQLRTNSHLIDERLPRWQERLEQRVDACLHEAVSALQQQIDAAKNAEQLTPAQRAQVAHIVRTEATALFERPVRQSARHVAAELMRGYLSALNLRVDRLRRRFDRVVVAAIVMTAAAALLGYYVGVVT